MKKLFTENWHRIFPKTTLYGIEERILDLKDELEAIRSPLGKRGMYFTTLTDEKEIESELDKLTIRRQFILDKRDSLFWKIVWNIIVPVVVATITAYMVSKFNI